MACRASAEYIPLMTTSPGIVLFYLIERGQGYLRLEGTREEFHFRRAHLRTGPVRKGDRVRFVLRQGRQGYYADEITAAELA